MLKFLVFGDLHYDDLNDSDNRIAELVEKAKVEQVDFIVSLGDLCFAIEENRHVPEKLQSAGIPIYHTIGNHDTQVTPIETTLQFLGKEKSYGSFEYGEYKFIILDTCYWRSETGDYHFPNAKMVPSVYPVVPAEQVEWLKQELSDNKKYVIFSHMSLVNEFAKRGIRNRQEILDLFEGKEVLLCMNGHDHGVDLKTVNGIPFYTVNSAAHYCWWGGNPPGSDVRELPYKNALHAVVELDEKEIRIKGISSDWLGETPDDVGVYDHRWNGVSVEPGTSSHIIKLD